MTNSTRDTILLEIPEEFHSERLLIRPPMAGDGPAINAAILESFEELRLWLPWAQTKPTVEESEAHARKAHARFLTREDIQLLLFLKGTNTLVGSSGLHRIDWSVPKFEIGYWIRTSMNGKGYMTEAVNAISDFAFNTLKARRVEIRTSPRNIPSCNVAERAGFELEGKLRNFCRGAEGNLEDEVIYAKTQ